MREPRQILIEAIKNAPNQSQRELADATFEEISRDAGALRAVFEYWFINTMKSVEIRKTKGSLTLIRRKQRVFTGRKTAKKLKQQIMSALMTHVLSNGKELRFATFGDCSRDGGWLTDVGRRGKAGEIVGNKLTEADLRSIWLRHSQRLAA